MAEGKAEKTNAIEGMIKAKELFRQPLLTMELTEVEKISCGIVVEKYNTLQAEFQKVSLALKGMVSNIVQSRGMDPSKFGVNLALGRILSIESPASGDSSKPKE